MTNKKPRIYKQAREINIRRSQQEKEAEVGSYDRIHTSVNTRMTKKEFEANRDFYNELWEQERKGFGFDKKTGISNKSAYGDLPDYADYVNWGSRGGSSSSRKKWPSNAVRMKAERIKDKLRAGSQLKERDHDFLKTLDRELSMEVLAAAKEGKTGRPRAYHADRPSQAKERVAAMRARRKGIEREDSKNQEEEGDL